MDRRRRSVIVLVGILGLLAVSSGPVQAELKPPRPPLPGSTVDIQLLALNDFHGNLLPPSGSSGRVGTTDAGGAAFLATHVANLEATNPANTFVVSAGDLIGASPLLSALFHDEPTIEAMNQIGLDYNAVGNHEFDEGVTELRRMQDGGCHPVEGCLDGDGFGGADFQFLAANVTMGSGKTGPNTLFPPYAIERRNGIPIAFIGMTLEGTPNIVSQAGIQGWTFHDEADTVNALIPKLRGEGVETIVVLLHEGGQPTELNINGCAGVSGPIIDIVDRMSDEVDLVISGHTHQPYNCVFDGTPVTSAFSFGRLVTDIDMRISTSTREPTSISINNRIVTRDVTASAAINSLITRYQSFAAPIANRIIGHITADLTRTNDASLEQAMGNAIADSQQTAMAGPAGSVFALMNPGGVRGDLLFNASAGGEPPGAVTYGEAFTVQPFGNGLLTMTLTGAQIDQVLEQQFCGLNSPFNSPTPGFFKVLLPSAALSYTWDEDIANSAGNLNCATANAVNASSITINGVPVAPATSYRVTVNTFLADGGDGFPAFIGGTNRTGGPVDLDALEAYLQLSEPVGISPPALNRINRIN